MEALDSPQPNRKRPDQNWDCNLFEAVTNFFVLWNAAYLIFGTQPTAQQDATVTMRSLDHIFWVFFAFEMVRSFLC